MINGAYWVLTLGQVVFQALVLNLLMFFTSPNAVRKILFLLLFYRWGKWDTKRLSGLSRVPQVTSDRPAAQGRLSPVLTYLATRKCCHLKQREDICPSHLDFLAKYKSSLMRRNRSNIVLLICSLHYNLYTMAWGNQEHIRWGLLPGSLRFITYIWWWCVFNIPLMDIFLVR